MLVEPNCNKRKCSHFIEDGEVIYLEKDNEASEVPTCPAFPKGIPSEIAYGKDKHLKIRPDQKGKLVYEGIKIQ